MGSNSDDAGVKVRRNSTLVVHFLNYWSQHWWMIVASQATLAMESQKLYHEWIWPIVIVADYRFSRKRQWTGLCHAISSVLCKNTIKCCRSTSETWEELVNNSFDVSLHQYTNYSRTAHHPGYISAQKTMDSMRTDAKGI